jgi:phosphate transport system permease protein
VISGLRPGRLPHPGTVLVWSVPLAICAVFAWMLGDILLHGLDHLSFSFLIEEPRKSGRAGGIGPILVATCLIVTICLTVSLPISLGAAVLLSEFLRHADRSGRAIRISLDMLAGIPSIVFGIVGNAVFCRFFGFGYSIMAGGLTLACMVLPVLIRTTEQAIGDVPEAYRLGAVALGFSKLRTIRRILIPIAAPSILVGALLAVGRSFAETAALLFTSGYVDRMPSSLGDPGRALSIHILDLAMNIPGGDAAAYGSALVLIGLLFFINGAIQCITLVWRRTAGLTAAI